jgi:parallel beta-helix repeat protein
MSSNIFSGILVSLLLISMLTLAFNIQPINADGGTIYIRADGSVYPPTAPIFTADNVTYTLTGNITADANGIAIERDDIVLNGEGYTLQGPGVVESKGIYLDGRSNVTIKNTTIEAFYYCIWLNYSSNNGISENNITESSFRGIYFESSSSNNISRNNITNNGEGLLFESSSSNSISENNITNNDFGIWLRSSLSNNIYGNNITNNQEGIVLTSSSSNGISGNKITNRGDGVDLLSSSNNNSISENNITNNTNGIWLTFASSNKVSGNNITNNMKGIYLESSLSNSIFHNNFVNNNVQVYSTSDSANIWDDGYPSGGNYWSDYNGTDIHKGLYQNETGNDRIGDTPYVIDANNTDNYPSMSPWISIVGDLNGDGKVNLADLQLLAQVYMSKLGDINWNPLADIAPPYGLIGLTDLVTLATHYGQHNP